MAETNEGPSAADKPDAKTPSKESAKPAANPAALPIRTMRDDLREAKQAGSAAEPTSLSPAVQKAPTKQLFPAPVRPPVLPSPQSIGIQKLAEKPSVPAKKPQPVSTSQLLAELPFQQSSSKPPKKKSDKLLVILIVVFAVSALAAVGVWAWIFFAPNGTGKQALTQEDTAPKTLTEIIPSDSLLIAYYQVADDTQRTLLTNIWQANDDATMLKTLGGDPRLLLGLSSVQQFVYVLLPGDPRLYLVVEGTSEVDQMLAERSNVQSLKLGQWRILHSFSTDLYASALAEGSRADTDATVASFGKPLTLYIDGELLGQLHEKIDVLAGSITELVMSVDFTRENESLIARFARENDEAGLPFAPGADITGILAQVPADAAFIRTGGSFAAQAYRVSNPGGTELINLLSQPYAYYERIGDDGSADVGTVVSLPPSLSNSLTLPDSTIETLLPILHTAADLGSEPAVQLAFTDATYNEVPLRYVNIDTPQLSLDYAILDDFLGFASSKEGMQRLVDVHQGTASGADTTWGELEAISRELGPGRVFGLLTQPALKRLLPGGEAAESLPFAAAFDTNEPAALAGFLAVSGIEESQ